MRWERIRITLAYLAAFPPFALGWLAGAIIRLLRLAKAAIEEGYQAGSKL